MFDWEDLRHFAAFARSGSLSAASRELKVDHVTVARRVSALEAALGLKLVDRRPRAYVLTGDGERIAALADRMTGEAFAVERLAKAGAAGPAGSISVNAPPAAAVKLIAPRLGMLAAACPQLEIELASDLRNISLGRREADIAVRLSRPADGDLVARKVGAMGFDLYGTVAHLARAPADRAFVGYDSSLEGSIQQGWLDALRGSRPIVMRSNNILAQAAAAGAGVGLAVLPDFVARGEPDLIRADGTPPMAREIWLAVHRDLRNAAPVRAVMTFLAGCFEDC